MPGDDACSMALQHSFSWLPVPEVVRSAQVVNRYCHLAAMSNSLWRVFCERLWRGKVHVPARFREAAGVKLEEPAPEEAESGYAAPRTGKNDQRC